MIRLLGLATGRFYGRHPWQLLLALTGISLGVGVYVGVDLASSSAARAFDLSASVVRGRTTHHLLSAGGDLDEKVYTELVVRRGIAHAAPVVELDVGIPNRPGNACTAARNRSARGGERSELRRFRTGQPLISSS